MFTNNIEQLEEKGFKIERLSDFRTQVTHQKQFVIESSGNNVDAFFLEEEKVYSMMFSGYPINGQLQENIQQHSTPLLHTINVFSDTVDVDDESDDDSGKVVPTSFGELEIGDIFFKQEGGKFEYKKVTESTCVKEGSMIGGSLELPIIPTFSVFINEMTTEILSSEQKSNIVSNVPAGLAENDFVEAVYMDFENIAGFETLDDNVVSALVSELWSMYSS